MHAYNPSFFHESLKFLLFILLSPLSFRLFLSIFSTTLFLYLLIPHAFTHLLYANRGEVERLGSSSTPNVQLGTLSLTS